MLTWKVTGINSKVEDNNDIGLSDEAGICRQLHLWRGCLHRFPDKAMLEPRAALGYKQQPAAKNKAWSDGTVSKQSHMSFDSFGWTALRDWNQPVWKQQLALIEVIISGKIMIFLHLKYIWLHLLYLNYAQICCNRVTSQYMGRPWRNYVWKLNWRSLIMKHKFFYCATTV